MSSHRDTLYSGNWLAEYCSMFKLKFRDSCLSADLDKPSQKIPASCVPFCKEWTIVFHSFNCHSGIFYEYLVYTLISSWNSQRVGVGDFICLCLHFKYLIFALKFS